MNSAAIFVRGGSDDGRSVMNDHRIAIDEETDHAHDDQHPLSG